MVTMRIKPSVSLFNTTSIWPSADSQFPFSLSHNRATPAPNLPPHNPSPRFSVPTALPCFTCAAQTLAAGQRPLLYTTIMPDDRNDPARAALYEGMEARMDDEYVRLRIQHQLHKDAMGGELIQVPTLPHDAHISILDSATGDGRWMAEVAAEYPHATLLGPTSSPSTLSS